MTVPAVAKGRGAWAPTENGTKFYDWVKDKPRDGSRGPIDVNWQAVNLGVKAIKNRLHALGYGPEDTSGVFTELTALDVKRAQKGFGFADSQQDGVVGVQTAKALWKDLLIWFGGVYHVPASQLYGFMMLESVADPGAVGYLTPTDRGLFQINIVAHPNITVEQAFDPHFATDYTAKRLGEARAHFSGKTVELKNYCSVAQHNSPAQAEVWYRTGAPPTEQIKKYVDLVMLHASQFEV